MQNESSACRRTSIGGQALIEGIMMRGPKKTSVCCRMADGSITTDIIEDKRIKDKVKILGWPLIRGIVNLVESMKLGYKALMISADKSLDEETEKEQEKKDGKKGGVPAPVMSALMVVAAIIGVVIAIALFAYLPSLLFDFINKQTNFTITGFKTIFEGVLKIGIFVGYIALIATMKDIKRMFMYHGAEHKTIFCYEHGEELTVENVRKYKRFHPRCGTSFMILMLLVGIVVSSILGIAFDELLMPKMRIFWVIIKILLVPVICGLGYELIKVCGKYDNKLTRIISAPGMWMQRLTTKEPDDSMIEVAIQALKEVLPGDDSDIIDIAGHKGLKTNDLASNS
ncbi:MAG TPA: DUF1385 domain-containing protein [Firmicutes bacterium]|nr:DUF1385 domain-containing protein [Bacillota bacterium]